MLQSLEAVEVEAEALGEFEEALALEVEVVDMAEAALEVDILLGVGQIDAMTVVMTEVVGMTEEMTVVAGMTEVVEMIDATMIDEETVIRAEIDRID
jgi:hypothetical protein